MVLVKQIYTTKSVQHKWHFHLWWNFSSKNTYLFIFTHFWWKHSSQTEEHACHKHTFIFFRITFVKVPMAFAKHIHIVMYDFHLFERFVIFGNGLQLFYGKFAFFQVSSHHIRVIGCTFFFFSKTQSVANVIENPPQSTLMG